MAYNLYSDYISLINNPDDFAMPYRLHGRTDLSVMIDKYSKLGNKSSGMIVKFAGGLWQ